MGKSQLLQEVKSELESKAFDVELNERYHGIDVSIYAKSKVSDKKLFVYVVDSGRALPVHCINLSNIKEGNSKILRIPNCEYMVYAPNGAVENALLECVETGIPIYTNEKDFKNALKKYSPNNA